MRKIIVIAQNEFATSFRKHIFLIMAALFLFMSVVSVYVGSTTRNAEWGAYQNIVQVAAASGTQAPPAPGIYPLSILHNLTDYIIMIGAVLAIFIGFDGFSGERYRGTMHMILAKPISISGFISGKLLGAGSIIGTLLFVTLISNLVLFTVLSGFAPTAGEVARLILFILAAFIYMMLFYTVSLWVSAQSRDRTYGFLILMVLWITISFVIPQLADSQRNFVFAVNNVAGTVTQVPTETTLSHLINLFSPAVQFQQIGNDFLQTAPDTAKMGVAALTHKNALELVYLLALSGCAGLATVHAARKERAL